MTTNFPVGFKKHWTLVLAPALQIRAGQWSVTANFGPSTAHLYHVMIIMAGGFSRGQVDSPELPETPEIIEMTASFTKVTKYLTKFRETLINYVWEKSYVKKQ